MLKQLHLTSKFQGFFFFICSLLLVYFKLLNVSSTCHYLPLKRGGVVLFVKIYSCRYSRKFQIRKFITRINGVMCLPKLAVVCKRVSTESGKYSRHLYRTTCKSLCVRVMPDSSRREQLLFPLGNIWFSTSIIIVVWRSVEEGAMTVIGSTLKSNPPPSTANRNRYIRFRRRRW